MIRVGNTSSYRVAVVNLRHTSGRVVALIACWYCCLSIDFHTNFSEFSQQYQEAFAANDTFHTGRQQQGVTGLYAELSPLPFFRGAAAVRALAYAGGGREEGAALPDTNKPITAAQETSPAGRAGEILRRNRDGSASQSSTREGAMLEHSRHEQHELASEARGVENQHKRKRPEGEKERPLQEARNETHAGGGESDGAQKHPQTQKPEEQPHKEEGKKKKKLHLRKFLRNVTDWLFGKRPTPGPQKELQHADEKAEDQKVFLKSDSSAGERERSTARVSASTGATHAAPPSAAGGAGGSSYLETVLPYPLYMTGAAKRWEKRARAEGMIREPRRSRSAVENRFRVALRAPSFASLQAPAAVSVSFPHGTDSDVDPTASHVAKEERKELHETAAFAEERNPKTAAHNSSISAALAAPVSAVSAAGGYPHSRAAFPYMGIASKGWREKNREERVSSEPRRSRSIADNRYSAAELAPSSTSLQDPAAASVVFPSAGASVTGSVARSSVAHDVSGASDVNPRAAHAAVRRLAAAPGDEGERVTKDDDRGRAEQFGVSTLVQPQTRAEQKYASTAVVTENMNLGQPDSETLDLFLPEISRSRTYRRRRRGRQHAEEASGRSGWGRPLWSSVASAAGANEETRMPSVLTQAASKADTASQGMQNIATTADREVAAGGAQLGPVEHNSWRKWDDHATGTGGLVTPAPPPQPTPWSAPSPVRTLQTTGSLTSWDREESRLTGIPSSTYLSGDTSSASKVELARQRHYQNSVLSDVLGTTAAISEEVKGATSGTPNGPAQRTATQGYPSKSVTGLGLSSKEAPQYFSGSRGTQFQAGPLLWQQEQQQLSGEIDNLLRVPGEEHQHELGLSHVFPEQVQEGQVGQPAATSNAKEAEEEKEMQKLLRQKYIAQPLAGKQRMKLFVRIVLNLMAVAATSLVAAFVMEGYSISASTQYMVIVGLIGAMLGERILRGLRDVGNSAQLLVQDAFLRGERQHVLAVAEAVKTIREQEKRAKAARRSSEEGRADVDIFPEGINSPSEDDEGNEDVDDLDLQGGGAWN